MHQNSVTDNGTCQNLTRLDVGHDALDDGNCLVDHCLIGAAYSYAAIVLDIDLNAGLLDDLVVTLPCLPTTSPIFCGSMEI